MGHKTCAGVYGIKIKGDIAVIASALTVENLHDRVKLGRLRSLETI